MQPVHFHGFTKGLLLCGWLTIVGCEGSVGKPLSPADRAAKSTNETQSTEETMLTVQSEPFGQTEDGQPITGFSLRNHHGMKVGLINRGGIITSVEVPDRKGEFANVTLHFSDPAEYLVNGPYFGGVCGRYANRIAHGKFSLDGTEYQLATNGDHHLHGGKEHFMRKLWKAETFQTDKVVGVKMIYTSPDMEENYPGTLKSVVTYTLNDDNELTIDYEATTDKPTILNLTNHAYWNLSGADGSLVLDHDLTLFCDKYLIVDEGSIPTGEQAPVAGTCMDFLKPQKIGARIDQTVNGAGGYDHCYVVNGKPGELRPTAKIVDPKSGRVMEISTTEPGVQFYTGNHLKGTPETGNAPKHGAFCLETQHFPDSPNHPDFPTTRLNPGEKYTQKTVHKFSVAK
ncbi:aldose epimerase family protein [Schlesneria paludicola]|uniref:aldose epimerase family protein n=1 Tax=Schlesneria paludicola TaxID=360056 RepID=UPI00029A9D89|nr:aldose epimerase family protein [Schlesneria paludicola]